MATNDVSSYAWPIVGKNTIGPSLLDATGVPIQQTASMGIVYNGAATPTFSDIKEAADKLNRTMPIYNKEKLEPFIEAVLDLYYSMADEEWDEATTARLEAVAEQLRIFDGDVV